MNWPVRASRPRSCSLRFAIGITPLRRQVAEKSEGECALRWLSARVISTAHHLRHAPLVDTDESGCLMLEKPSFLYKKADMGCHFGGYMWGVFTFHRVGPLPKSDETGLTLALGNDRFSRLIPISQPRLHRGLRPGARQRFRAFFLWHNSRSYTRRRRPLSAISVGMPPNPTGKPVCLSVGCLQGKSRRFRMPSHIRGALCDG